MSKARTIEILLDASAAAWTAACVSASVMLAQPSPGISPQIAIAFACAAAAALVIYRILADMRGPQHQLAQFDLLPIETVEPDFVAELEEELLLTSAVAVCKPLEELLLTPAMAVLRSELLLTRGQMLISPVQEAEPLLLDDVLAELCPESRVVQLFDPERIPTAGELKSRIDRHLGRAHRDVPAKAEPDASQALYEALADLRRSLA